MKRFSAWTAAALVASVLTSPVWAQSSTTNPLRKPAAPVTAPAAPSVPAAPTAPAATSPTKPASQAQLTQRNKMKGCGAEWQALKKAGKTEGKTWRQFSSECLKKD
jgi:hypothetical protein